MLKINSHCGRNQGELIRLTIAELEIVRGASLNPWGYLNRHDEIATAEHIVLLGRVSGQTKEFSERD
jgi:hypothetical protein